MGLLLELRCVCLCVLVYVPTFVFIHLLCLATISQDHNLYLDNMAPAPS